MNELSTTSQSQNFMQNVESQRAVQEVQASYVIAKRFPRDEMGALARIQNACKRKRVAETATYSYPKGGQNVTGPSIRLAEVLARNWGNLNHGIQELSRENGESLVRAFCTDLETNTTKVIDFTVRHEIYTRKGMKQLTDPREIYELVANNGSRRLRNAILAIIPEDIQEEAREACHRTLLSADKDVPILERIKKLVLKFNELNISPAMIETKLGHKIEATTIEEIVKLGSIYTSIRDGFAPVTSYFEQPKNLTAAPVEIEATLFSLENQDQVTELKKIFASYRIPETDWNSILKDIEGKNYEDEIKKLVRTFS